VRRAQQAAVELGDGGVEAVVQAAKVDPGIVR
jgi:hypothetical protein